MFKKIALKVAQTLKPRLTGVSILMYHSVGEDSAFFTVRPKEFRAQMQQIKRSGYPVRRLKDVVADMQQGKTLSPAVVITFDDGYENNFSQALPILREFGFPATIFVAAGFIGKSRRNSEGVELPLMTEEQLRQAEQSGFVDLMPHGHGHIDLSKADKQEIHFDLHNSQEILKKISKSEQNILAYPWGRYNQEVIHIVKKLGFKAAVTVYEGVVRAGDPLFELKRNAIDSWTTLSQFRAKISDAIELYTSFKKR